MERFVRQLNIATFKRQLEAPVDERQRQMRLRLLAEEEAKEYGALARRPEAVP